MKIKGAIFDLDGTLLDSMYVWDNIGKRFLESKKIVVRDDIQDALRSMSLPQSAEYFRTDYGVQESVKEIIDYVNKMIEDKYKNDVLLKGNVLDVLNSLKQHGIKMCVATATDKHLVEYSLKRNGIMDYFEGIFTCTLVNAGKDKPDIYLRSQELLGTDINETYVFEDALFAMKTAKKAGFPVVGIYDKSAKQQQDDIKKISDIYLNSYDEWSHIYD